ncbi:uncharacterized protein LOC120006658 [Tripterygium wilfordii]|uniref:uncharacterized protein LOC120006658 n=1 Tax=Tripterygium wilfordii TaxID=458696 RepID=UPI0018F7FE22|nr:uncharacterized protein LOC120006658 [Tripterygium wilfordii]
MRMGGEIASVKNSMEHHPFHSDFLDLQDCQRPQKFSDDNMRKQDFVGDHNNDLTGQFHCNEAERSREHKSHASQERNEERKRFRRNTDRTKQCGTVSAWIRRPSTKEKDAKRKTNRSESSDVKGRCKKH